MLNSINAEAWCTLFWLDAASVFIALCVGPLQQRETRGPAQVVK